uniref:Uncharacterized protein n=1 Tax=Mimivirus LCMiAC02 TaxID=2506609 RepID=A0A4D5XFM3_9VIRU|nr:MAG: uncharacterized protein LCMiAC02_04370 [Mimivirus LCMiAC02]
MSTKSNKCVVKKKKDNIITEDEFEPREKLLHNSLTRYYRNLKLKHIKTMLDIIDQKSHVSLRLLDWFVTRFAKDNNTTYIIKNRKDPFYIHISYKCQLRSFRKKYFDPFKRSGKFEFSYEKKNRDKKILTTIGQLNFFKWAINNKIIKYVQDNHEMILSAMIKSNKEDKNRKKHKMEKKKKDKKKIKKEEKVKISKYGIDIEAIKVIDGDDEVEKYVVSFD